MCVGFRLAGSWRFLKYISHPASIIRKARCYIDFCLQNLSAPGPSGGGEKISTFLLGVFHHVVARSRIFNAIIGASKICFEIRASPTCYPAIVFVILSQLCRKSKGMQASCPSLSKAFHSNSALTQPQLRQAVVRYSISKKGFNCKRCNFF